MAATHPKSQAVNKLSRIVTNGAIHEHSPVVETGTAWLSIASRPPDLRLARRLRGSLRRIPSLFYDCAIRATLEPKAGK